MNLATVMAVLPAVIDLVKMVEKLMPESGKGAQKLALVRTLAAELYDQLDDVVDNFEELWAALQPFITLFVKLANAFGMFKKGDAPPAEVPHQPV